MSVSQARSHHLRRIVALGATLILAAGMSACSALKSESSSSASAPHTIAPGKTLTVSTSFYPIQYLAEAIGGKLVKVSTVTPANVEPHDFELSGKATAELGKADLIAYVPGFQPSLDKAVKEVGSGPTVVDLSKPANLVHTRGLRRSTSTARRPPTAPRPRPVPPPPRRPARPSTASTATMSTPRAVRGTMATSTRTSGSTRTA